MPILLRERIRQSHNVLRSLRVGYILQNRILLSALVRFGGTDRHPDQCLPSSHLEPGAIGYRVSVGSELYIYLFSVRVQLLPDLDIPSGRPEVALLDGHELHNDPLHQRGNR